MPELFISAETKTADKRLRTLERRLSGESDTTLMGEIAVVVMEKNKRNFERVRQPEKTVAWKQQYGLSTDPLVESGQMKAELTTEKGIKTITPTELRFGSTSLAKGEGRGREITVAKAHLVQKGSKHQAKHKVLSATLTSRREISELVDDYLTRP